LSSEGYEVLITTLADDLNLAEYSSHFDGNIIEITDVLRILPRVKLFPNEEKVIRWIIAHNLEKYSLKIPSIDVFNTLVDKHDLGMWCLRHHIPTPLVPEKSILVKSNEYIVKPRIGSGSKGVSTMLGRDINETIRDTNVIQFKLSQEHGVLGFFALVNQGKINKYYMHKRIITRPRAGGVTVVSAVHPCIEQVVRDSERLLRSVGYSGLVMLEWMLDPDSQQYKVIECNPRLWGSFLLSTRLEVSMMELYIRDEGFDKPGDLFKEKEFIIWPYAGFCALAILVQKWLTGHRPVLIGISNTTLRKSILYYAKILVKRF
jgi:hypothetical protein